MAHWGFCKVGGFDDKEKVYVQSYSSLRANGFIVVLESEFWIWMHDGWYRDLSEPA